jgi:L-seryl-tRNA(Ser) seleniumtransferase
MAQVSGSGSPTSESTAPARLPSVDRLVGLAACAELVRRHGRSFVTGEARALLAELRQTLRAAQNPDIALDDASLATALAARCAQRLAPRMRAVINMTGTVLHTNLGRAVLAEVAIQRVVEAMAAPAALEYDIERGTRGDRDTIVEGLLCELTGAEAATVVNNNAAAVLLTIAALAGGREAIVSRGELVEIGGSFRLPDVMASAGARMVEVGTTNRTHLADYERAITPATALLFKVHTSNYAVQGFTSSVPERELAVLARARGVPLATDLGSGSLIDLARYGLPKEPTPSEMIAAGCDVVTFSGDKLLGGPQAGLIVGTRAAIDRIRRFPMKRALRLSKLPLAALEATLALYLQPERLVRDLPALRWLTRPADEIAVIAQALCEPLAEALAPGYRVAVTEMSSQIGSGSLPVDRLPSYGLAIEPALRGRRGSGAALEALAVALRGLPVPVIGRIQDDRLLLDCRCVDDPRGLLEQLDALKARLPAA